MATIDDVEHGLCTDISPTLEKPKDAYAASLRDEASHQEQGQMDGCLISQNSVRFAQL